MRTLKKIQDEIYRLEKLSIKAMKKQFPIGKLIVYLHGRQRRVCFVIHHNNNHAQLKVRGISGAEYWLDADRIEL